MELVEKRVVCAICFSDEKLLKEETLRSLNIYYYNYLKKFNLLNICEKCFNDSYKLFRSDLPGFLDWIDENDNRSEENQEEIQKLRDKFNLSVDLLLEDPDQYLENLEKYTLTLENKIISESIKI